MPQAIPPGLSQEHVLLALVDLDAGLGSVFGEPTKYEFVHGGQRYAPKAVVGCAHRYLAGTVLAPDRFSGGEAPGQANYVLRALGFTVVRKGEAGPEDERDARRDWTAVEVALVVTDYFAMLQKELFREPYNKTEHRIAPRRGLSTRSDGSVEFKHQNISGVLADRGLPYIPGYKPRFNYQELLAEEVEGFLNRASAYLGRLESAPLLNPVGAPVPTAVPNNLFEDPPERMAVPTPRSAHINRLVMSGLHRGTVYSSGIESSCPGCCP